MQIRSHVDNPELILSTIAFHAIAALFGKWMKKVIDGVASGPVNLVLCEILASFIFVSCIMEKGLWYANVNENYFHVATAAQCIYWSTFLPGRANPCPIIADHGIVMTMAVFPFQILGGLSGAIFMKKYFWPLGMTLFHSTINANCEDTTINTSMMSGIAIETGLVVLLSVLPIAYKAVGRMTNLGEENAVLIFQSIIVAYVVKTFIGVTGAMMNPLLAVVVNFGCLNSKDDIIEHVLFYWLGPLVVSFALGFMSKSENKQKTE